MKRFSSYRVTLLFLVFVLGASLRPFFAVAQTCEEPIGKMVSVQGTVESQKAGDTQWQPVKLNDALCPGDTIRVLNNSRAELALANQSVLRINENTTITLEGVDEDRTTLVDLLKGAALFFSRGTRNLKVKSQYAIFGVRGTEFFIRVEERQAFMSVFEGTVLAENQAGSLTVKNDQSTVVEAGKGTGADGCGATPGCRAVGPLLSAGTLLSSGRNTRWSGRRCPLSCLSGFADALRRSCG